MPEFASSGEVIHGDFSACGIDIDVFASGEVFDAHATRDGVEVDFASDVAVLDGDGTACAVDDEVFAACGVLNIDGSACGSDLVIDVGIHWDGDGGDVVEDLVIVPWPDEFADPVEPLFLFLFHLKDAIDEGEFDLWVVLFVFVIDLDGLNIAFDDVDGAGIGFDLKG